jgi:DNA repair protein RadC
MSKYIYPFRLSVVRERTDRYECLDNSLSVCEIARQLLSDAPTERFLMFMLNAKNRVLGFVEVSVGSLNAFVIHPRDAYRAAVIMGASAVVVAHNHPSGDPAPSREDRESTKRLALAGKILGIRLLDHVVVGEDGHYSFADAGEIEHAVAY